jgi:para-nitrobenzyl esterase
MKLSYKRWLGLAGVVSLLVAGAVALTGGASASSAPTATCANGTLVQTDKGPVCGTVGSGFREWLGIPFAAPPVGRLRWRPPQPHAPWSTPLQAVVSGSACPQLANGPASAPSDNEDCLYLNVVVPSPAGSAPLPVLAHIYGGGFTIGANSIYDGTHLATAGHEVFVGINYRLGVLGFLAHKALGPHSGDYGLEDQQAALAWVRRNIAAFGGDPHNVTIFGESAGGSSTCDQIASPPAAGLFQKAISESGEYNSLLGAPTSLQPQDCKATLPTQAQADSAGASFAASVGCGTASDVAACLRSVPVRTLLATPGGTLAPIINGTTLRMQLQQAFATGKVNHVSVMIGVGRDENLAGTPTTAAQYKALVEAQYGAAAPQVLARYPLARFASPYLAFRTVAADSNTVCPALVTDQRLSNRIPVFAYEMDDTDAPLIFYSNPALPNGSYHVVEVGFTFPGAFGMTTNLDADQQVLADQVTAEWTTFARTGDPTAKGTPVWPRFTTATQEVMSLQPGGDSQITTANSISLDHNCGFWDSLSR